MSHGFFTWLSELTRRNTLLAILVVLVASMAATWSFLNVQEAVKNSRATLLNNLLTTQAEALVIWAEEKRGDTVQWAKDPTIIAITEKLVHRHQLNDRGLTDQASDHAVFLDRISPAVEDLRLAAANIVTIDGVVIASLAPEYIGATLVPEFFSSLKPAFNSGSIFIGPTLEQDRLANPAAGRERLSVIWTAAPVKSRDGEILAVLSLGRYATGKFARTLEVTRPGDTGETYAFNAHGVLISPSRFEPKLKEIGLLEGDGTLTPGLLRLREYDPALGIYLHMPFTALVGMAIEMWKSTPARLQGTILKPYRNYIGIPVIGAWRWLPALNLGIAIEIAEVEAYAPIGFVTTNLVVLLMTLVLTLFLGPLLPPLLWRRFVPLKDGDLIGSHRLVRRIGEGGQADVYAGIHERLEKPVAIKVMKGQLREEQEARFEREARLLAALNHPGIVAVFDIDYCEDGRPYYVMELVDGPSLRQLVEDHGPLAEGLACQLLKQVCDTVQYLHDHDITHRDLKPENILIQDTTMGVRQVKLIDFGLAKSLTEKDRMHLTQDVKLMGTLGYLAPERIKDPGDTDIQGDVYSVGAIAYFLFTGQELIPDIGNLDTPSPRLVPDSEFIKNDDLAGVIVKAMSIRKSDRWPSCRALREALPHSPTCEEDCLDSPHGQNSASANHQR